jgi:hypothetical protein
MINTNLENKIRVWGLFLRAHERVLIILLSAFLLFHFGNKIEDEIIKRKTVKSDTAAIIVASDTTANKNAADQLAQIKTTADIQAKAFQAIDAANQAKLRAQQAKDAVANQQQIIDRWNALLSMPKGSLNTNNDVDTVTQNAAIETVKNLERLPVLETEVTNLTAELSEDQNIIVRQSDLITGLDKQIVDEKASHAADVSLEKSKSKRNWLRGFKWGFVTGVVATEAVRVAIGHP